MKLLVIYHDGRSGAAKSLCLLKHTKVKGIVFSKLVKSKKKINRNFFLVPVLLVKLLISKKVLINGVAVLTNPIIPLVFPIIKNKKVFVYWHEMEYQYLESLEYFSIHHFRVIKLIKRTSQIADSQMVASWIKSYFGVSNHVNLLYECINFNLLSNQKLKIKTHDLGNKIICIGNLCTRKGIDFYLDLADRLKGSWSFQWIGKNVEYNEERQQRVKEINLKFSTNRIEILGFKSNPIEFIQMADVFILPSIEEPFGIVYLEALAVGKFVIVSPNSGFAELIMNKPNLGYVYEDFDDLIEFMNKKMMSFIKSPEMVDERIKFASEFDIPNFHKNLQNIVSIY